MADLPDLLRSVLRRADRAHVDTLTSVSNDLSGIVLSDAAGVSIASVDELHLRLGQRPAWRRPVVAGAPTDERSLVVARGVANGRTTTQIAAELGVSERTVTSVRARLNTDPVQANAASGRAGVAVIGRPGLTRDLVHAALAAHRSDVSAGGVAHADDAVRVLVLPGAREFAVSGVARLVVVGSLPAGFAVSEAIAAGMVGVVSVASKVADLVAAVDRAALGEVTLPASTVQQLVDESYGGQSSDQVTFTDREADVIDGIRRGESVKQTARRLGLSPKTIENRRQLLYRRFGVRAARSLERAVADVLPAGDSVELSEAGEGGVTDRW